MALFCVGERTPHGVQRVAPSRPASTPAETLDVSVLIAKEQELLNAWPIIAIQKFRQVSVGHTSAARLLS
jgi:hypothetical protein